jgi:hypothetical protein
MLGMRPKVAGSDPAKDNGFLWVIKICSMCLLQRGVKSSIPCHRFTTCKKTLQSIIEMLCWQISWPCFSPVVLLLCYKVAVVDESGGLETV